MRWVIIRAFAAVSFEAWSVMVSVRVRKVGGQRMKLLKADHSRSLKYSYSLVKVEDVGCVSEVLENGNRLTSAVRIEVEIGFNRMPSLLSRQIRVAARPASMTSSTHYCEVLRI